MLIMRNLAMGLCIGIFCSGAQAQSGFRNWSEFVKWCQSQGGDPLPNPPRCMPHQGPAQIVTPPEEATNFDKESEAYSSLIARITQGVPDQMTFERRYKTPPESSDEMSERLLRLYDFVADLRTYTAGELDDAIYERHRVHTISGEITEMAEETAAIQYQNKIMASYVFQSEDAASLLGAYACDQQRNALRWFKYITPKDSQSEAVIYYLDSAGVGTGLARPTRIPELKGYVEPVTAVIPRDHPYYPIAAISADYSNIDKINYLNTSYGAFLRLKGEINAVRNGYDEKWLRTKEDELYRLRVLRDKAVFDGTQLANQVAVAHENIVVKAVESFVWKTYVTHISIEETKKFYDLNKSWYQLGKASQITDNEVKQKVEAGKAALDILGSRAEGMKQFLDVQKRTLDLITNTERFLSEAPEIAALATPEETRSFLKAIDKEQGGFYMGLMEKYKTDLAPSSPLAQALRSVKVPKPFQSIVRKLGLADNFEDVP